MDTLFPYTPLFRPLLWVWHSALLSSTLTHLWQQLHRRLDCLVCHKSEEHTSELQSLMRISYAVFCLKKKQNHDKLACCNHSVEQLHLQPSINKPNQPTIDQEALLTHEHHSTP